MADTPEKPGADTGANVPETVVVGLIAAPGEPTDTTVAHLRDLPDRISQRIPGVRWDVRFVSDHLVHGPSNLTEVIVAARRRLLDEGWHLAVVITDLPLQTARRPVLAHASATHGVAVLSVPALGPVGLKRRTPDAIVRLVSALLADSGATDAADHTAVSRRAWELGAPVRTDVAGVALVTGVVAGNLRLLFGMLRANRPWRVAAHLSRALVGALAAGLAALVTSDIWRLATGVGWLRLLLLAIGSVIGVVLTIVVGGGLWERVPPQSGAREQATLFNVVTLVTVVIGVLSFYLCLFALIALCALLVVPHTILASSIGRDVSAADWWMVAWLVTSVAMVGGALGAGLESDETVHEAAYRYQSDPGT
jgi:uncharacterized membrane protein